MNHGFGGASAPDVAASGTGFRRLSRRGWVVALVMLAAWRIFFAFYHSYTPLGPSMVPPVGSTGVTISDWAEAGPWHMNPMASVVAGPDGAKGFHLGVTGDVCGVAGFPIARWSARVEAFRVSARARCEDVRPGDADYKLARIALFYRDEAGKPHWEWPHVVAGFRGTKSWRRVGDIMPIPSFARAAELSIVQMGRQGTLDVADLTVEAMKVTPGHAWVVAIAGAAWGLAAMAGVRILRLLRRRRGVWVLAAGLAIVAGMLLPGRTIEWTEDLMVAGIVKAMGAGEGPASIPVSPLPQDRPTNGVTAAAAPPAVATVRSDPRRWDWRRWMPWTRHPDFAGELRRRFDVHKAGHVIAFALLSMASVASFIPFPGAVPDRRRRWANLVGGLLIYACAAEQLQWLTLTRHAALSGVAINAVGIAIGIALAVLTATARRRPPRAGTEPSQRRRRASWSACRSS